MSDIDEEYNRFYSRSKRYFKLNNYEKSLEALKKAYKLKPSEQIQIKINKIESIILSNDDFEDDEIKFKRDENKLLIEDRFYVNKRSYELLYNYQKEGILWLFKLFERRKGGILADDMGLGKTVQVIFFLRELFESDLIKSAIIVMPKSLLINWEREFTKWAPDSTVLMYTGNERERNLNKVRRRGGVLLTTYGTIMSSWDELNSDPEFKWNVLALDEGHKIKNPSSKTFKTVNAIRADMRLVMTGTAVQNKLKELWALFDFTHQGTLLGTYTTFGIEYERPITSSRNKDATETEKIYGDEIAKSLKLLIKPFFLRRTKEEVLKLDSDVTDKNTPKLKRKNDFIIWIQMTDAQIDFYQRFLQLDEIKQLLTMSEKRSPLVELNILKKICDHPRLLRSEHCAEMGMTFAERIEDVDLTMLQKESGKMEFLLTLLKKLVSNNHKCLVFSQSKIILNIIQRILKSNNIKLLRLDGDILKPSDRQNIVDLFNNDVSYKVLLLTSQVGGVGLTLTGADRAIIYDLNWNPSIDAQAVDRLYRIGQLQNVVVYRLITCGTIEEKIYRRQIFKDSVNRQTTGVQELDKNPFRYFTQGELLELFILDNPHISKTQMQLEKMHAKFRKSDVILDKHIVWLKEQQIYGITDHDLMFSQKEETINVDAETREILLDHKQQAEDRLIKEAMINATEEGQLRTLMGKLSLNEYKTKAKEKISNEHMFIPSRDDIKRPVSHFEQSKIPSYFQPINTKQSQKTSEFINLISEDEDDKIMSNLSKYNVLNINQISVNGAELKTEKINISLENEIDLDNINEYHHDEDIGIDMIINEESHESNIGRKGGNEESYSNEDDSFQQENEIDGINLIVKEGKELNVRSIERKIRNEESDTTDGEDDSYESSNDECEEENNGSNSNESNESDNDSSEDKSTEFVTDVNLPIVRTRLRRCVISSDEEEIINDQILEDNLNKIDSDILNISIENTNVDYAKNSDMKKSFEDNENEVDKSGEVMLDDDIMMTTVKLQNNNFISDVEDAYAISNSSISSMIYDRDTSGGVDHKNIKSLCPAVVSSSIDESSDDISQQQEESFYEVDVLDESI